MFFFLTLYMQTVLDYSPIQTGLAYLPLTAGSSSRPSISSQLFTRIGTKPVIVVGSRVAAAGLYWLSRIPVDGSTCRTSCLACWSPPSASAAVFVGATTAANAGVSEDKAGLAAGLLNTGTQLGAALGLAIFSAIATERTTSLLEAGHSTVESAATEGFPARPPGRRVLRARRGWRGAPDPQRTSVHGGERISLRSTSLREHAFGGADSGSPQ